MSSSKKIEQWEITRYWEIFSSLSNGATHLDGSQAAAVLKNSRLSDAQLERIWDLADVDGDGRLDFEEFCVAMRLVYDLMNGDLATLPPSLPDWLVPESKAHLVQANRALHSGGSPSLRNPPHPDSADEDDDDPDVPGLRGGFDWYTSPSARARYDNIYADTRDPRTGLVSFAALADATTDLHLPDTDLRSAWNRVNPRSAPAVNHAAAHAFLHILYQRHAGARLPRSVPASLRATFDQAHIDHDLDAHRPVAPARRGFDADADTPTSRKAQFGDAYISRLSGGGRGLKGTDIAPSADADAERRRLQKHLNGIEDRLAQGKTGARGRPDSRSTLARRELETLRDYKRRVLRELEAGNSGGDGGKGLSGVAEDVAVVREQVEGLEAHLRRREEVLQGLRGELEAERAAAR